MSGEGRMGTGEEEGLEESIEAVRRAVALTDAYVATAGPGHTARHGGLSGYRQAEGEAIRTLLTRLGEGRRDADGGEGEGEGPG